MDQNRVFHRYCCNCPLYPVFCYSWIGRSHVELKALHPAAGWKKPVIIGGAVIAVSLYFFFDPSTAGFFPPCPFNKVTGLDCSGFCSQRALHALLDRKRVV